ADARTSYKLFNRFQVKYRVRDGNLFGTPRILMREARVGTTVEPWVGAPLPGRVGPANNSVYVGPKSISLTNDGTPESLAVSATNALAYPLKWNNIGSRIDFGTTLGTGRLISNQVYPTYFIFDNVSK